MPMIDGATAEARPGRCAGSGAVKDGRERALPEAEVTCVGGALWEAQVGREAPLCEARVKATIKNRKSARRPGT